MLSTKCTFARKYSPAPSSSLMCRMSVPFAKTFAGVDDIARAMDDIGRIGASRGISGRWRRRSARSDIDAEAGQECFCESGAVVLSEGPKVMNILSHEGIFD